MSGDAYRDIDGEEWREEIEDYPVLKHAWEEQAGDLQDFFKFIDQRLWQNELTALILRPAYEPNPHISEFSRLLKVDFPELCREEPFPMSVQALESLKSIRNAMRAIGVFPSLYTKRLGAVGGGFSSGKSAFINSFLTSSALTLAEGIKPVTAIPSYVLTDPDNIEIVGINYRHARFHIPSEIYKQLSHTALKNLNFSIKDIIEYIAVSLPLNPEYFRYICIMDTPGYNPPESGSKKQDRITALSYLKKAEFVIWLVGLDANGTLPASDIEFLKFLNGHEKKAVPLYVVCSKSDMRPDVEVKAVMEDIANILSREDLNWAGVCAYSSKQKQQTSYIRKSIYSFLHELNNPVDVYSEYQNRIANIFKMYSAYITKECDFVDETRRKIKRMELTAFEAGAIGIADEDFSMENDLEELMQRVCGNVSRSQRIAHISSMKENFMRCLESFCKELKIASAKRKFCIQCGTPFNGEGSICCNCAK